MPVTRQKILIGRAQHADQQLVLHRTSIHEQILVLRRPPIECRQPRKPRHLHALALRLDLDRVLAEFAAQHGAQTLQPRFGQRALLGLQLDNRPLVRLEMEGYIRPRQRQPPHRVRNRLRLRSLGLHEFQACRRRIEKIAHIHPRTIAGEPAPRSRLRPVNATRIYRDLKRPIGAPRTAEDRQPRHRSDRRQRLAPETHRADIQQVDMPVIVGGQLRRRMPLDRHRQLVHRHAIAVILDHQPDQTAALDPNPDGARASIQRVLDQLLGGRSRALNHFARSDAVHRVRRQPADASFRVFQG